MRSSTIEDKRLEYFKRLYDEKTKTLDLKDYFHNAQADQDSLYDALYYALNKMDIKNIVFSNDFKMKRELTRFLDRLQPTIAKPR